MDIKRYNLQILIVYLFISILSYSQDSLEEYNEIISTETLNFKEIELKVDSLIKVVTTNKNFHFLAEVQYEYAKWLFVKQKNIDKAIFVSRHNLSLFDTLRIDNDILYKKTLNNLGAFYERNKNYLEAFKSFEKLAQLKSIDDYVIEAYRLAGKNLKNLGDLYKATEYYEPSITLAKEFNYPDLFVKNSISASINYRVIGTKNGFEKSEQILKSAIQFIDTIDYKQAKIPLSNIFLLHNHLGNTYNEKPEFEFEKAKENYDIALKIAKKLKDRRHLRRLGNIYNDIGYLYVQKNNSKALEYLKKSLQYKSNSRTTSYTYRSLSNYFLNNSNYQEALKDIQLSINSLTKIDTNNIQNLPSKNALYKCKYKSALLNSLIEKAKIWIALYRHKRENNNLTNALKTLKLADLLADILRSESNEYQSKVFWRKMSNDIYLNGVKVSYLLNNLSSTFYFMEKNKSILLLEDVVKENILSEINLPKQLINKQNNFEKLIFDLSQEIKKVEKNDSLKRKLLNLKYRYSNFKDSIRNQYNIFYNLKASPELISLKKAASFLKSNSVFLEYILAKEIGYGLLISDTEQIIFEIKNVESLFNNVQKYRNLLETPFSNKADIENYNSISKTIYDQLIPEKIRKNISGKNITIIPDYFLQNLPFEALKINKASYLINQHQINYAYSISFLNKNSQIERNNKRGFLGIAPINFNYNLSDLPSSEEEITSSSKFFKATNYLNSDASTINFTKNIKGHQIIHIASHANANDSINPWIAYSDRKFSLDELYLTKNTAELVVLSGCNTSLGKINIGEGIMSLARGFFNTGANTVISTLWTVNDSSSSEITSKFYTYLKEGKNKSEALHLSKLDYINSHTLSEKSPYYWASFILIGDSNKLVFKNNYSLIIISILVLLLFLFLLFFKKNK